MIKHVLSILFFLCLALGVNAEIYGREKIQYPLADDFIDVVIVTHPKDKGTLDLCIDGVRENCNKVRRVIVVSSAPLTDKAEWFNEANFPFSKADIALKLAKNNSENAQKFIQNGPIGWYYQQVLKLYSMFVIPDISSNVLVIDADTVILNPVEFLNSQHGGLFCTSDKLPKLSYYKHAARMLPGYKVIHSKYYSVCHHMLFQRAILEDLFQTVESYHKMPFWEAFCWCVDLREDSSGTRLAKCRASEYEIYYNFALTHTDQVQLRHLKWKDSSKLESINLFKKNGYHYVSFHTYLRK